MKRLLLGAALLAATAAVADVAPAGATNECRGLQVCVRVAGPWVVVPASSASPRPRVDFQLSCPRGFVIGGLDAELTDRAIDVEFGGRLGSPVNPGVTTSRSALFRATYAGADAARSELPSASRLPARVGRWVRARSVPSTIGRLSTGRADCPSSAHGSAAPRNGARRECVRCE